MEYRKLIEFGKSSYVISLPKDWIRENKLIKGDLIAIGETDEGLIVSPKKAEQQLSELKRGTIDITHMGIKETKNRIIAYYIQNYDEIIIKGPNVKDNLAEIRETVHNLIALEIMEETAEKITGKAFLNMRDIDIPILIRKMDLITKEMLADVKKAKDEEVGVNISLRDQDVNRMAYLIFRTIKYLQNNPALAKEKKMSPEKLLKSWNISDSIEKIGDNVKRAAKLMRRLEDFDEKGWTDLLALLAKIETMYSTALKCYYTQDQKLAFEIALKKMDLLKECREVYGKYWQTPWIPVIIEKYKSMIGAIQPISKSVIN